jgi:phenylacetate-coenzyme A ligase PaaK-like adenylate-forming protein
MSTSTKTRLRAPSASELDPEERMSRDELQALQLSRLQHTVRHAYESVPLYHRKFADAGVHPDDIRSLDDVAKLPFTTKADLRETYPFGMFAVPMSRVARIHASSGTTGRPTVVGYTQHDLGNWAHLIARSLRASGVRPGMLVHNAYGYGLFTGGMGFHLGAMRLGATVVPASGGMTQRQLTLIEDLKPKVLTCTPSYAVTLGEAARAEGRDVSSLRAGILGAEPWSEPLRAQIESLLPVKALDVYGLSEVIGPGVATECLEAQSGLHVNEDHFLVESVDIDSGEPVPDGEPGELVFTTLTKQALPLLRYRTGDLASLTRGRCDCGRTLVRMSKVLGRRDDMLVVRGVNVYPSEVEAVVLGYRDLGRSRLAPHYLLVVDERAPVPELIVCCESDEPDAVHREEIVRQLHERLGLRARVQPYGAGSLPRTEVGKAVRVVRWREGEAPLPGL